MPKLTRFNIWTRKFDSEEISSDQILEENVPMKTIRWYLVKYQNKWFGSKKFYSAYEPVVIPVTKKTISDSTEWFLVIKRIE